MRFTIDHKAKKNSRGCWPDMSDDDLLEAAEKAAIYSTHPLATHRSGTILFEIKEGVVVAAYEEDQVANRAMETVCPDCEADGGYCETCNSTGIIKQSVGEIAAQLKKQRLMEEQRVQKFFRTKTNRKQISGAEKFPHAPVR